MNHFNTANLNLAKNGWELLVNEKGQLDARPGDIVKIAIATVSPLDFEAGEAIRSVSHIEFWLEIEKAGDDQLTGILKSRPGYETEIKDGTKFEIGDRIAFRKENILAIR